MAREDTNRTDRTADQADWFDQQVQNQQNASGGGRQGTNDGKIQGTGSTQTQAASGPPALNPRDPTSVRAYVDYYASQPGANPSLKNDPDYWVGKITSGELGNDANYIVGKFMTPEGAPAGSIASLGGGYSADAANVTADVGAAGRGFQSAQQMGQFQQPNAFTADRITKPADVMAQQVAAERIAAPGTITPERIAAERLAQPDTIQAERIQGPNALQAQNLAAPSQFGGVSKTDLEADPGYQYRLKQAQQAAENSAAAQGIARGSNTWKALMSQASDMAAQQYQQTYQNKFGEWQSNINNQLGYTQANNQANAQAYGLTNQYQQQAALANQQYGYQAQAQNAANRMNQGQFNANLGFQANALNANLGYNAQAQNIANLMNTNQFNAGLNMQGQLANQSANLNAGQFNANMGFNTQQANVQNALNAYNSTNQAQLAAYQANVANALGQGQLGLGYQNAANQFALGRGQLGLGYANYGLASQGQNYNQGLSTWMANQGANQQLWNNNYSLAQLGLMANGQLAGAGQNYANQAGNLYTGIGNAQGAGSIANGNAASNAIGNGMSYAQLMAMLSQYQNRGGGGGYFQGNPPPYFAY